MNGGPIEFDPDKEAANLAKHKVGLGRARLVLDGPCVEAVDDRFDYGEVRIRAVGPMAGLGDRLYVVVYTWRDGHRRVISLRKANDKEVRSYRGRDAGDGG